MFDSDASVAPVPAKPKRSSNVKAKRIETPAPTDDEEGEEDFEDLPPLPKPKKKKKPPPPPSDRTTRAPEERAVTTKQGKIDKENLEAQVKKLQNKLSKIEKEKRRTATGLDTPTPMPVAAANEGPESEESDESDTPAVFSSSIMLLKPINSPDPKTPSVLRRGHIRDKSLTSQPSSISRRAFLTLSSSPILARDSSPASLTNHNPPSVDPQAEAGNDIDKVSQQEQETVSRKRSHSPALSTFQKKAKLTLKQPQLRAGVSLGPKPKAGDYEDVVEAMLLRAMHEYEALICTKDAFPDASLQGRWAQSTWSAVVKATGENYELTMRTSSLMKKRGSRIRGHVLKLVRGQIVSTYGFSRQTTPTAVAKNCLLSAQLVKDGAFHYKNPETLSGYAQNKIISEIVHLAWFEDASSSGIIFSQYFDPITLNSYALIFTLVEACIREWSTGRLVKTDFSEKVYTPSYRAHQANIEHWSSLNPTVVENIRKKLYKRARRNAGASDDLAPTIHLMGEAEARVRNEMEGRTGETDSEMSNAE